MKVKIEEVLLVIESSPARQSPSLQSEWYPLSSSCSDHLSSVASTSQNLFLPSRCLSFKATLGPSWGLQLLPFSVFPCKPGAILWRHETDILGELKWERTGSSP
jgi:hypothetical protein